ncbi:MAG: GNAT family N-acetyltransferase [Terriglobales bacterium]
MGNAVGNALAGSQHVIVSGQAPHTNLIVEEIASWTEFLRLQPRWRALAEGDADGVLLGHDWTAQCWKTCPELHPSGPEGVAEAPLVLALRPTGGDVAAVLALRHNRRSRRICFLEESRSQRLDLLAQPGCAASAWRAVASYFRRRRGWDRLDLQFLRPGGVAHAGAAFAAAGLAWRRRGTVAQRRIVLDRPWEAVEASFSPYLRANFRRRQKRLLAQGELTLTVHGAVDELDSVLADCFGLEQRGWKGSEGTAVASRPALLRFYRQLAFRMAARRQLRLYCLRLNGRVIAFEYCVCNAVARQLFSLKIAYDEQFRTASPGIVLRWLLLRQAWGATTVYDFLGDDVAWKRDWTPDALQLTHMRIYNRTLRGQAWRTRASVHALMVRGLPAGWFH